MTVLKHYTIENLWFMISSSFLAGTLLMAAMFN